MSPADRFKAWIDSLSMSWKDRVGGWVATWLGKGLKTLMKDYEPEIIALTRDTLTKMETNPNIPPELKDIIDKSLKTGDIFNVICGYMMTLIGSIPALFGLGRPLGRTWEYYQDQALHTARLDPQAVITAWRRDPAANTKLFADLKDLGWNDDRIETLKFVTTIIPGVGDLVRMAVREAFTPEIAEKFGQYQDYPPAITEWGEKQGLSKEWLERYWAAHWDLPSPSQGFEMLHRGVIDEATLAMLLRALDVMPYWRDKLTAISWNVPTRVDIRRFYQLGVIDDARLRQLYTAFGYHGSDLDNIVEFTKRYTSTDKTATEKELSKAEIIKGVKTGVISRAEGEDLIMDLGYTAEEATYLLAINIPPDEEAAVVKSRELTKADVIAGLKAAIITVDEAKTLLLELRYNSDDADFLLKIYQATISPPEAARDKEASKADIVKAVKIGLITPEDGYLMLQDIGFTPEASQFILMVQAEASPFSPVNFTEFKEMTQKYRVAVGLEAKPMPEEIKKLGAEVVRLSAEVDTLARSVNQEKAALVQEEGLPGSATAHLKQLQAAMYKAQAELARVKTDYNAKVSEWRHGVK